MPGILSDQPTPEQLPPPNAGVLDQFARGDMIIKACSGCGVVVARGFEERHAATHAQNN